MQVKNTFQARGVSVKEAQVEDKNTLLERIVSALKQLWKDLFDDESEFRPAVLRTKSLEGWKVTGDKILNNLKLSEGYFDPEKKSLQAGTRMSYDNGHLQMKEEGDFGSDEQLRDGQRTVFNRDGSVQSIDYLNDGPLHSRRDDYPTWTPAAHAKAVKCEYERKKREYDESQFRERNLIRIPFETINSWEDKLLKGKPVDPRVAQDLLAQFDKGYELVEKKDRSSEITSLNILLSIAQETSIAGDDNEKFIDFLLDVFMPEKVGFCRDNSPEKKRFTISENCPVVENLEMIECYATVFNKCIDRIASKTLQTKIKMLFANLPLENREKYPQLFLSMKDQKALIIEHIDREEEKLLGGIKTRSHAGAMEGNTSAFSPYEWHLLCKLAYSDRLSENNRSEVRELIKNHAKDISTESEEKHELESKNFDWDANKAWIMNNPFSDVTFHEKESSYSPPQEVIHLKRLVKAREFFLQHNFIPKWYHATGAGKRHESPHPENQMKIIKSRQINVEKGMYEGAWVSNCIEDTYGNRGFALSDLLESVDSQPNIETVDHHYFFQRWRGLRRPIKLNQLPAIFWVSSEKFTFPYGYKVEDPQARQDEKAYKTTIRQLVQTHSLKAISVMSNQQMHTMQEVVYEALGSPNLSKAWWQKRKTPKSLQYNAFELFLKAVHLY